MKPLKNSEVNNFSLH